MNTTGGMIANIILPVGVLMFLQGIYWQFGKNTSLTNIIKIIF